ncbi:MAG: hypothetical protein AAFP77_06960 [Bacteroidota bacterium]
MNFQSSKPYRQVYSWAGKSTAQAHESNQLNPSLAKSGDEDSIDMYFRRLFRYSIGFLILLILAPFIMLGLVIAIAALF